MSTQTQQQQPGKPQAISQADFQKQAQAVQALIYNDVFVPAFYKLASERGIRINNNDDLHEALEMGEILHQQELTRSSGTIKQASASLKGLVSKQAGVRQQPARNPSVEALVKEAAALPQLRQAVTAGVQLQHLAATGLVQQAA